MLLSNSGSLHPNEPPSNLLAEKIPYSVTVTDVKRTGERMFSGRQIEGVS